MAALFMAEQGRARTFGEGDASQNIGIGFFSLGQFENSAENFVALWIPLTL